MECPIRAKVARTCLLCVIVAALFLALCEALLFSCHVKGTGWYTLQTQRQNQSLALMKEIAIMLTNYHFLHGQYPTANHIQVLASELVKGPATEVPIEDGWRQLFGCQVESQSFCIWSTGSAGGDAGTEPSWLAEQGGMIPFGEFTGDLIFVGGNRAALFFRQSGEVVVVQYNEAREYSEGPFGIGKRIGLAAYRVSNRVSPPRRIQD